jgi:hypothetical protein
VPPPRNQPSVEELVTMELHAVEKPRARSRNATVLRTPSQRVYMENLAAQQGMTLAELDVKIKAEFSQSLDTISKTNASHLIGRLLARLKRLT